MNEEIGTEAEQLPEKEYINGIFVAVRDDEVNWLTGVIVTGKRGGQEGYCAGESEKKENEIE